MGRSKGSRTRTTRSKKTRADVKSEAVKQRGRQPLALLLPVVVFALTLVAIFFEPLFSSEHLFPPVDGSPIFQNGYQISELRNFWGWWRSAGVGRGFGAAPFFPTRLFAIVLPPLVYHLATYMFDVAFLAAAALYFLWGKRIRGIAAWLPSVALAFSGHTFSLIAAGHRGKLDTMPYAVLIFGLLDRAVSRSSPFHYALATACAIFGLSAQPDVMAFFLMLAAVYWCFLIVRQWRKAPETRKRIVRSTLLGGVVAIFLAGLLSAGMLRDVNRRILPTRTKAQDGGSHSKWEFATGWSLPPEEMAEFVVPHLFGVETSNRQAPYWGRLGRSLGWMNTRRGLMNLRQHTVYIGALQLLFAFFALIALIFGRRAPPSSTSADCGKAKADDQSAELPADAGTVTPPWKQRSEIIFWGAVWLTTVLLALGRFFPLYRVFFSLPFCSRFRCPVKFIHLTEVATCVLFAYGLSAFFSLWSSRHRARGQALSWHSNLHRVFWVICAISSLLLFTLSGIVPSLSSLREYWNTLGFGPAHDVLAATMRGAFIHGGIVFALGGFVFALADFGPFNGKTVLIAGALAVSVVCVDCIVTNKPYIHTRDISPWYAENPIEAHIEKARFPRLACLLAQSNPDIWPFGNLHIKNIDTLDSSEAHRFGEDYREFFGTLGQGLRLWQLTSTRYVLAPVAMLKQWKSIRAFKPIAYFSLANGRYTEQISSATAHAALLEFAAALPRALVYHDWQVLEHNEAVRRLNSPEWKPHLSLLVEGPIEERHSLTPPTKAKILRHEQTYIHIEAECQEPGILLVNDRFDTDWKATVDNTPAEILRCNGLMRGIRLEPGLHNIKLVYRPGLPVFLLNQLACLILLLWMCVRGWLRVRSRFRGADNTEV